MSKKYFLANNQMTAMNIFNYRKLYNENVFQNVGDKKIDLWNDVPLYGKVDFKNYAIYLSESNLRQLDSEGGETLLALDFVVDAFDELQSYFRKAKTLNRIKKSGIISKMNPVRAWVSSTNLHHEHIDSVYKLFVLSHLRETSKEDKIKDFEEFLNEFLVFAEQTKQSFPFTRSSFIKSRFCSPLTSGLMIEIEDKDRDNDSFKQKDILDDDNFIFFKEAAKRYGFFVDKNVPWRLVADVMSKKMKEYMGNYGIDGTQLFSNYYYRALDDDLNVLKNYMIHMWNGWCDSLPFSKDIKENCMGEKFLVNITRREKYNIDYPMFEEDKWIDFYFRIRLKESQVKLQEDEIKRKVKNAIDINKHLDIGKSLMYIEVECEK